ncbi:hypothetical protein FB451DRAFT_138280 [Mycena latifolia]|nr:hypothetical protein FB451DRAFT_138280 [Mycena latifolia]
MSDRPPLKAFPAWAPPLMRIVGSGISVVVAQMIIQIQMERILQSTLMTSRPLKTSLYDVEKGNSTAPLGQCQSTPDSSPWTTTASLQLPSKLSAYEDQNLIEMAAPSLPTNMPSRIRLACLQVLLLIGIGSTAVGYFGCFTVVQNSRASDTYIWLGVEVGLALLRIYIWGLNPSWDESTGLSWELQLPDDGEFAPAITTAQDYSTHILYQPTYLPHADTRWPGESKCDPFVVLTDSRFLDYISPYTGPVERFIDPDNHVAIYYTLAGHVQDGSSSPGAKILLTTVLDLESRNTSILAHRCPVKYPSTSGSDTASVYSASFEIMLDTGIMTAKCGNILPKNHEFRKTERFLAIAEHSQGIANRIGGVSPHEPSTCLMGPAFPEA